MKKFLPLVILFCSAIVHAQNLPHWMTEEEKQSLPSYLQNNSMIRDLTPPPFAPRTTAEWEEIQGILVTWTDYTSIIRQIIDYAQEECMVYVVCTDSESVKSNLTSNGVPLTNVKFLKYGFNSIWSRDYGQWNIYSNDVDDLSFVDWIYNRPRPKDDTIPQQLAVHLGLNIYQPVSSPSDLVHTGGNFMVDGHGTGFSSKLILDENGPGNDFGVSVKTETDIDTIMKNYLGLNRYILMETLPYDEIHHIDMHMKLLDEETLMMAEFPSGISDGPQIEANLQYVQDNFLDCYGRPYKIVRIPMVPSTSGSYPPQSSYRTYTNSVFINKTILVPTYREEYDTTAIRIYRQALPGYKVYGIDCDNSGANIISALGALHCITKEVGANDPIWIDHAPLQNTSDVINDYLVEAKIKTPSGVSAATLYWTTDTTAGFNAVAMAPELNDSFYAYIPAQIAGTQIFYYLNGESNSGRSVSKPLVAPHGWWKFNVEGSTGIASVENPSPKLFDPFPNPASDWVNIGFELPTPMNCQIQLVDVLGRIVFNSSSQTLQAGHHKIKVNVSSQAEGIYNVVLKATDQTLSARLIVSRS